MIKKLSTFILMFCISSISGASVPKLPSHDYIIDKDGNLVMWVYIWGEVERPGGVQVFDSSTLIQAISLTGGPTDNADLQHVRLTRKNSSKERILDLEEYLKTGSDKVNIILKPGDVIYIPKNKGYEWKRIIGYIADVATIVTLFLLIRDEAVKGQ